MDKETLPLKSLKLTIIGLFALLILSGCTVNFTPSESNSDSNTSKTNTSDNPSVNAEHRNYLKETQDLAGKGMVKGSRLSVNGDYDIESIISEYGRKPDSEDVADNNIAYEKYKDMNVVFGVQGRGDVLVDIRSYDPYLHNITRSEVDKVLGKPDNIRKLKGQSIYVYHVNGYEFKLIFLLTKSDPTIDHISVYSPDKAN